MDAKAVMEVRDARHGHPMPCPLLGQSCPWDQSPAAIQPNFLQKFIARTIYFWPSATVVLFMALVAVVVVLLLGL
jgi:hypothetical protein